MLLRRPSRADRLSGCRGGTCRHWTGDGVRGRDKGHQGVEAEVEGGESPAVHGSSRVIHSGTPAAVFHHGFDPSIPSIMAPLGEANDPPHLEGVVQ